MQCMKLSMDSKGKGVRIGSGWSMEGGLTHTFLVHHTGPHSPEVPWQSSTTTQPDIIYMGFPSIESTVCAIYEKFLSLSHNYSLSSITIYIYIVLDIVSNMEMNDGDACRKSANLDRKSVV